MANAVKPVPEGYQTVIPHLVVKDGAKAIEFYKEAFGAEEVCRMCFPQTTDLMHAELKLGDCHIFLGMECPDYGVLGAETLGGSPVTIHLYVEDVDALFDRAVQAGATVEMPVADQFWGDRYGKLVDPFGHRWSLASHLEDLTPEQMQERMAAAFPAEAAQANSGHSA